MQYVCSRCGEPVKGWNDMTHRCPDHRREDAKRYKMPRWRQWTMANRDAKVLSNDIPL